MDSRRDLVHVLRWPLALLVVAVLGILVAAFLDTTSAREYALVVGAPSLTVLLPLALVWLVVAVTLHLLRRR